MIVYQFEKVAAPSGQQGFLASSTLRFARISPYRSRVFDPNVIKVLRVRPICFVKVLWIERHRHRWVISMGALLPHQHNYRNPGENKSELNITSPPACIMRTRTLVTVPIPPTVRPVVIRPSPASRTNSRFFESGICELKRLSHPPTSRVLIHI